MTLQAEGFSKTELTLAMNFLDQIPFNKLLGLKPKLLSDTRCEFTMSMRDDLIGNKVAVTRMEFHNEEGVLIAVGTGTYLCG